ncbi:tRNA threonylcarbamoyladenosine biosynthesis protein TsaE [Lewinella marina]|uniref:tRNA threonylcarbamoyladenosine biosynthesis protein TsaE n=1 Tax=Neolewinella marina TaxID=438751 RepID=A0A2G0CDX8_9BACT|nr:tRNA (adenosine(37)-N6)-threonylcarbamoyltransferase complex ATPase subunit type 1 TsaE [Neolewinella marina]NJB87529.1 tRNA threonylcarbamoyladenosine biosynthesis protein TsaE [Neolewinella marina]PHK98165.1 tRNA (adenosine(37)-N6)-threonylcarbamoyltransferase complex ATPase subunit type 1 TsaE [Neolewinella marina]
MDIWYTLDDLPRVATRVLREWGRDRVFALTGELGAGKTTLVAELCRQLGVDEPVSSPTFSIVNEYDGAYGVIYHLDCYRLEDVEEAMDAGLEELLATAPGAVFVEWPAVIEPLLPPDVVFLRLGHDPQGGAQRRLNITGGESAS